MENNQVCENPFEDQKRAALELYEELTNKAGHWSSFIRDAIRDYDPIGVAKQITDLQKELKETKEAAIQMSNIATDRLNEQYAQLKEREELLDRAEGWLTQMKGYSNYPSDADHIDSLIQEINKLKTKTDKGE